MRLSDIPWHSRTITTAASSRALCFQLGLLSTSSPGIYSVFIFIVKTYSSPSLRRRHRDFLAAPLTDLSRLLPHPAMEAPLSSPSLTQPPQYFHGHKAPPTSAPQQQQNPTQSSNQQYQPQQQPQSQSDTTSPFLRDFSLVAEAAKRAQMAVLMRDMEAVGL